MEERLFLFIQDVVMKVTGKKGLVYDTDFVKDLGLTSFDVMNIVCAFEDHFDVLCLIVSKMFSEDTRDSFGRDSALYTSICDLLLLETIQTLQN